MKTSLKWISVVIALLLLFYPVVFYGQLPSSKTSNFTGTVVDSLSAQPVAGATISVVGSSLHTITNERGIFSLPGNLAPPFSLRVQSVGYKTHAFKVNSKDFTLTLSPEVQDLSEVIVVGYGKQKKITLTNAVSVIDGAEFTRRASSNVQQSLQGQLPGITVQDLGGAPGRSATNIRVRGVTTFNIDNSSTSGYDLSKNNALVIVDGAEQQLSDINPQDIESISVLKDAASTAIYGSRATNGVILVTTKAAKKGAAVVTYDGYYALQKAVNKPQQMGIGAYMKLQQYAYANAGFEVPVNYTDSSIQIWVNAEDRYKYPLPNTWFETMLHTAPQMSQSVSVGGGNEVIRSRLSLRYQDQNGVIDNYGNKIAEIRLNTDFNPIKSLTFNANLNYRYNYSYQPTVDPFNNMFHGGMWAVPKYPDGTYGLSTQGNNPLMFDEIGGKTENRNDYFTGIVQANWQIIPGLSISSYFSGRAYFTGIKAFTNAYENTDSIKGVTKSVDKNSLTETRNNLKEYTWNNLLTYEHNWGKHHLKALGGYSQIENVQNFLSAYRERFYNNDLGSINEGADDGTKDNSGYDAKYALRSYFGRVNYDFDNKYLFEANGRRDGSSKFTGDKQYGFYPSFSLGWVMSNESFWGAIQPLVQEFKLRGSWGKTGNQSVDLYSYYSSLSLQGYDFGGIPVTGYRQTTIANLDLGWESTTQLDLGFDASLFNRRLNITVDYYRKLTDDILLNLDIPAIVGLKAPFTNAGSVENKGWEFSFNYNKPASAGGLGYHLGGNISINTNKVLDLKGTGPYITGTDINPRYIIAEGLPINTLWGYKTDGLFQSQEEIDEYGATYAANTQPGDLKYVDLNKDGKIDAADMTVIGNSFPKYNFGLNAGISFRGFEMNFLFQGAADVDTRIAGALAEAGNQEGFTDEIFTNDYWTPMHTDAYYPRPLKYDLRNQATSDRQVIDGSYVRLKNLQLAYNIADNIIQRLHLQRLRLYVSGTNLWTLSKLNKWHLDPETPSGRAVYYPQTAVYTFGINLQF